MATDDPLVFKTTDINLEYDIHWDVHLGKGINGFVVKCTHRASGQSYALKCLPNTATSEREVSLMWRCRDSPFIVRASAVFRNTLRVHNEPLPRARIVLVMALMSGGELFDRIVQRSSFNEREASMLLHKMASAIAHLHAKNIAHRDIKPENFLFRDATPESDLCLSDFGFAKEDHGDLVTPHCTPAYVCAEVADYVHRNRFPFEAAPFSYSKSCDMWSLGVILYIMLSGRMPFNVPKLVRSMMCTDPAERITAPDLLKHRWLAKPEDNVLATTEVLGSDDGYQEELHSPFLKVTLSDMREMAEKLPPPSPSKQSSGSDGAGAAVRVTEEEAAAQWPRDLASPDTVTGSPPPRASLTPTDESLTQPRNNCTPF